MLIGLLFAVAAATFPGPGTYTYSAAMAGRPLGQWSVAVKASGAQTELDENSTVNLAGMALTGSATLLLGPDLAPVRYDGHYRSPGQNVDTAVTVSSAGASVVSSIASAKAPLPLVAETKHYVIVEPGLVAGLFALPAQLNAWKESSVTWITPATAQAQALSIDRAAPPTRPSGVPATDASLSIAQPIAVTIWYDPTTLIPDRIDVPSQNAVLTRVH